MKALLLTLPIGTQIAIVYLLIINVITFFAFGFDKLRARKRGDRVSEKSLWLFTLIGGSIGALLGMKYFRHKTKKLSFQAVVAVILALQIALFSWLFVQ
ncbi:MAG: DUF1294 domain-containing protein [Candidatus Magasanikbacteria bacterium]|jgi:uncharacterized membrane protein YsdA (DUF1294 family)|nr:DUF1294 domain-containing protein [Candidatus Magasanikbacteria bacterium]